MIHNEFLSRAGHEHNRDAPAAFHGVGSKKLLGACCGFYLCWNIYQGFTGFTSLKIGDDALSKLILIIPGS
jgi:hypothetical protein